MCRGKLKDEVVKSFYSEGVRQPLKHALTDLPLRSQTDLRLTFILMFLTLSTK